MVSHSLSPSSDVHATSIMQTREGSEGGRTRHTQTGWLVGMHALVRQERGREGAKVLETGTKKQRQESKETEGG